LFNIIPYGARPVITQCLHHSIPNYGSLSPGVTS
jgi:hypothetical protein